MDGFDDIFLGATEAIGQAYFLLHVHGSEPVYRERVYCYELYHQMRYRWPKGTPFYLNGEVDKQQHPYFEGPGYPKPDLLVHIPGFRGNYAAIEVKSPGASRDEIRKDLGTLLQFRQWYDRSLYLIYGVQPEEALQRVRDCAETKEQLDAIELWVHRADNEPAVLVKEAG
jgi:hypothetical protein